MDMRYVQILFTWKIWAQADLERRIQQTHDKYLALYSNIGCLTSDYSTLDMDLMARYITTEELMYALCVTEQLRSHTPLRYAIREVHMRCARGDWVWNEFLIQFSPPPIPFGNREDDASRVGLGILESTLYFDCGDALLNPLQIEKWGWNETSRFSFAPLQSF